MKTITGKIKFIGGVLSVALIMIISTTYYLNEQTKSDSVAVNIAGRERMLTQNISKNVFWLRTSESVRFESLDASVKEFATNLEDLRNGNETRRIDRPDDETIHQKLSDVSALWKTFHAHIQTFKALIYDTNAEKTFLFTNHETILNYSDAVVKMMVAHNVEGRYIDDAGRQRMLSQKMAFHANRFIVNGSYEDYRKFYEAFTLYDKTLALFKTNAALMVLPEVGESIRQCARYWEKYTVYLESLMRDTKKINEEVEAIYTLNPILLKAMDDTVSSYAHRSKEKRQLLQNLQYIFGIFALALMGYSALLIRNIQKHFEGFLEQSEQLLPDAKNKEVQYEVEHRPCDHQDELDVASLRMEYFIKQMLDTVESAERSIAQTQEAAQKIGDMSEDAGGVTGEAIDEVTRKELDQALDASEDIAIQSIEDLGATGKMLAKLRETLSQTLEKVSQNKLHT